MKKQITILSVLLMGVLAYGQNCIVGNAENTEFIAEIFPENCLLGTKFNLTESKQLNAINLLGNTENAQVQMAIYQDELGVPAALLAQTEIVTIKKGLVKLPVNSLFLEAGAYWVMAMYDQPGHHSYINFDSDESQVYYSHFNFGEEIPLNAKNFNTFKGQAYTYFLSFDCDEDTGGSTDTEIKIYPNPASEYISVLHLKKPSQITLLNYLQEQVLQQEISPECNEISIHNLSKGIYFLFIDGAAPLLFIKEN